MAGNIKGITIEFRGDTTKLDKALRETRGEAKAFDKELGYINNSLKFNPNDVKLTSQKMTVLKQAAQDSEKRTKELNDALEQMKKSGVNETSADYRELEREIIRTKSKQEAYNKELAKMTEQPSKVDELAKKFETFGSKAQAAGQALKPLSTAGAAVDVALAGIAYNGGKTADELNTLSKQTGISTTDLQKYAAAADLVDVSVEAIASGQKKMKKTMYNAQQGSSKAAKAFEALGVSVTDANGELRDQSDVFDETIKALGAMENPTERDAIAMQIFGGSASELNSLIADGGKTYEQVAKIYEDNDLAIVDQETLNKANEFNDAIDTIKLTGQAALQQVGTQLAAYLVPAVQKLSEAIGKVMGWLSKLDPQVLAVIGVIAGVVAALAPVLIVVGKVATGISSIITLGSKIGPLLAGLSGPIGIVIAIIGALIAVGVLLYKNWDKIKETVTKVVAHIQAKWILLKRQLTTTINDIKKKVVDTWDNIKTTVTTTVTNLITAVKTAWTNLKTNVSTLVDGIKTKVSTVWDAIKTKVINVVDALKTAVATKFETIKGKIVAPIEKARDLIKAAIDKIKSIINTVKLSIPHFKLPHFKINGGKAPWGIGGLGTPPSFNIEWYKRGGIFNSPSLIGVGEAGAEAVLPIEKLKDWMQEMNGGVTINVYAREGMDIDALVNEIERKMTQNYKRRALAW